MPNSFKTMTFLAYIFQTGECVLIHNKAPNADNQCVCGALSDSAKNAPVTRKSTAFNVSRLSGIYSTYLQPERKHCMFDNTITHNSFLSAIR